MFNVLFVCTGNTCRSSMAEVIAKSIVDSQGDQLGHLNFSSAGVAALPGAPASNQAIQVMRERNINLEHHSASLLASEQVVGADLILTMSNGHKAIILHNCPELIDKVFQLSEYVLGTSWDIQDPYGQPVEVYRSCADQLEELLCGLFNKLSKAQEKN